MRFPGCQAIYARYLWRTRNRESILHFVANGVTTIRGMLGQPSQLSLRQLILLNWPNGCLFSSGSMPKTGFESELSQIFVRG
jgi:hypothetical protein